MAKEKQVEGNKTDKLQKFQEMLKIINRDFQPEDTLNMSYQEVLDMRCALAQGMHELVDIMPLVIADKLSMIQELNNNFNVSGRQVVVMTPKK